MSELDPRHLDKRTAERYMRLGLLDEKAWEKHLKSLPDVADKATVVDTTPEMMDDDSDDIDDAQE